MKISKLFEPVDMTTGNPVRQILVFTIPMLLGNIAQQLLIKPISEGADRLCILSHAATPSMASWLLKTYWDFLKQKKEGYKQYLTILEDMEA